MVKCIWVPLVLWYPNNTISPSTLNRGLISYLCSHDGEVHLGAFGFVVPFTIQYPLVPSIEGLFHTSVPMMVKCIWVPLVLWYPNNTTPPNTLNRGLIIQHPLIPIEGLLYTSVPMMVKCIWVPLVLWYPNNTISPSTLNRGLIS